MKKLITIYLLLFVLKLNATTYYVAPDGNDSNPGTFAQPWKSWGKAFNSGSWGTTPVISAGDTVYFRGGVYNKTLTEGDGSWYYPNIGEGGTGYEISRDGTAGNLIKYWAYPDDVEDGNYPILDCYNAYNPDIQFNWGIYSNGVDYVHFKNLHVRNVRQVLPNTVSAFGIQIGGNGTIIENCVAYNIWGVGFRCGGGPAITGNMYIINCDAYNCCDSLSASLPGNDGYGFSVIESTGNTYFKGCRAWLCGDDGFNAGILYEAQQSQYIEYDSCWSFRNGMLQGGGSGFKMGWITYTDGNLKRTYKNCIAAYNRWNGWKTNDYRASVAIYCNVYNNVAYHNGYQGGVEYVSGGFQIQKTPSDGEHEYLRLLRNNIAYDNEGDPVDLTSGAIYTHSNNSWDISGLTLQPSDFISLDSTGLTASRQLDGSLPDNDCYNYFLHLKSTSDLIDRGIDVGLDYSGDAPDLGAFEYDQSGGDGSPQLATLEPVNLIWTRTATSGGYLIQDGGSAITAKGVCWSTSEDPTTADSKTIDGTGDANYSSSITGLLPNTTYHVRAYATNIVGTGYGEDVIFTTDKWNHVRHGGKIVTHNGKPVIVR